MSRPWTPEERTAFGTQITVKRCCNGCGTQLGDVTEQEIEDAIGGRPLPDVRNECPLCTPYLEPAVASD